MNATLPILDKIRSIIWRKQPEVSLEARELIRRHRDLIRPVVESIVLETGRSVSEAHGIALCPAHDTPEYAELMESLSEEIDFTDALVSWPIVMTIAASEVWHLDLEFAGLANPWEPLVELFQLGYPAAYLDSPEMSSVHLEIYLRDGVETFPIC